MTSATDLLRSLGLGSRPVSTGSTAAPQTASGMSFSDLLSKASGGEFSTGLDVTVSAGAGIELNTEQLQRLAKIADAAEAQGASRVLVLMDGQALTMDVGVRQITGTADLNSVVTGIDAVVAAPGNASGAMSFGGTPIGPPGGSLTTNASLLNALAAIAQRR